METEINYDVKRKWYGKLSYTQQSNLKEKYDISPLLQARVAIEYMYDKEHIKEDNKETDIDNAATNYVIRILKETDYIDREIHLEYAFKAGAKYQKEIDSVIVSELLVALKNAIGELACYDLQKESITFISETQKLIDKANKYLTDKI